jgi:hypothetical protein
VIVPHWRGLQWIASIVTAPVSLMCRTTICSPFTDGQPAITPQGLQTPRSTDITIYFT